LGTSLLESVSKAVERIFAKAFFFFKTKLNYFLKEYLTEYLFFKFQGYPN
jgi:hypothetical protein